MDYGDIINTSFRIAWRHRTLWIFGLFASGYSSFAFSWQEDFSSFQGDSVDLEAFFSENFWVVPAVAGVILLINIAQLLLKSIAIPALIDAANRITRGGVYKFGISLQTGVNYMWRQLGLILLQVLVFIGFFGIMALIGVLLAMALGWIAALGLLVAIPVAIVFIFAVWTIFQLAYRALVARNVTISDALAEGWALLRTHLGACIVLGAIYIALSLGVGILISIIFLILALPFFALSAASDMPDWLLLLIGTPLLWIVLLPVGGFLGAVYENIYTIFYFRLYESPQQTSLSGTAPQPESGPEAG